MQKVRIIPLIQAVYFLITAVWPLVHLTSFLAVTGDKKEIWLLETVSILLLPYCLILIHLAFTSENNVIMPIAALLSSLGLGVIEIYYFLNGTIKWVYAVDSILQFIFVFYWILYIYNRRHSSSPRQSVL